MAAVPVFAAALRERRLSAGLSQERLAELAGITERTVRSLETGAARRPRRDTMHAVGQALGLDAGEFEQFVDSWRSSSGRLHDLFAEVSPAEWMTTAFARQRELSRETDVALRVEVDGKRQQYRMTARRALSITAPGLDRYYVFSGYDSTLTTTPPHPVPGKCSNVALGDVEVLPELKGIALELLFQRPLDVGQTYVFEYALDYPARTAGVPHNDTQTVWGVAAALRTLSIEVCFDPDDAPSRVWLTHQPQVDSVGGSAQAVEQVAVSPFGIATVVLAPAPVGGHGLHWEWPD